MAFGNDSSKNEPFANFLQILIAETLILSFHCQESYEEITIFESLIGAEFQIKWPNLDRIVARPLLRLGQLTQWLQQRRKDIRDSAKQHHSHESAS